MQMIQGWEEKMKVEQIKQSKSQMRHKGLTNVYINRLIAVNLAADQMKNTKFWFSISETNCLQFS